MLELEDTHPWLYQKFAIEGLFIRRGERFGQGCGLNYIASYDGVSQMPRGDNSWQRPR